MTNAVEFYLYEVTQSVRFIAIEQTVGTRGWEQGWDSVFNGLFGMTGRF